MPFEKEQLNFVPVRVVSIPVTFAVMGVIASFNELICNLINPSERR